MKSLITLLISILSITSITGQNDKRLKGIEKDLNNILETTHAAGFAVAVVEGDKVIYAKGFGYRDYENKIPVDANTLFAIGSVSKSFTSAILGKLRAEGKLSFDDSPRDYIPELEFYNNEMNNNIIIKDLMRHSTGLPRHDASWLLFPSPDKNTLIKRIAHQKPFTGVRQQWYYNNFMFLVQGVIAEKITGKSWEDNIRDSFFKPLEMNRSNTSIVEMQAASNASFAYRLNEDNVLSKIDENFVAGMSPAGAINSSVNDMAKWLITWINKGKYNGKEIIPETYVDEAMSSQMVVNGAYPADDLPGLYFNNYGYAWMLSSYKGHYRVAHNGSINGFTANASLFPTDKIGIVVLTNQNVYAANELVRNTIADRMLAVDKTDWLKRYVKEQEEAKIAQEEVKKQSVSSKIENTKPSHKITDFVGSYVNPGYGKFDIFVKNDSLFAYSVDKSKPSYLKHFHYDVFETFFKENGKFNMSNEGYGLKASFTSNTAGEISGVEIQLEPMVEPIVFKRISQSISVNAETLASYTGTYTYELQPETVLEVYIKNSALYARQTGLPEESELIPIEENTFSVKVLEGYKLIFVGSEDGSANEIKVIDSNGITLIANRK